MKKILFIILVAALMPALVYGQGMIFDSDEFSQLPKAPVTDGSKSIIALPFKTDLTPYVPKIITQGPHDQTCVAISTTVYAVGTQRAAANQITDPQKIILDYALSPLYFFAKTKNNNCGTGVKLDEVAKFLRDRGGISFQVLDAVSCADSRIGSIVNTTSELIKIREVQWVFQEGTSSQEDIKYSVKKQLSEKRPVVVGIPLYAGFKNITRQNPYYIPSGAQASNIGHAVTVIGYDDAKQSFKLVNSYGADWGENGMFYMKYTDFAAFAKGGFVMQLNPEPSKDGKPAKVQIGGTFDFKSISSSGSGLTFTNEVPKLIPGSNGLYELIKKDWKVGQQFQLYAENTMQGEHMCVFSINSKNQINIHWPRDMKFDEISYGLGESDLAGQNAKIIIPGSESALIIDEPGTDYLCILYGTNQIKPDLHKMLERLQASSGAIVQRLNNALGSRLITKGIAYSPNKMEFKTTQLQGDIVPIILEVKSR